MDPSSLNEPPGRPIRRRRWLRYLLGVLAIAMTPYVWSRAASPFRMLHVSAPNPGAEAAPPLDGTLRILTYNIAHGRGWAPSNWTSEHPTARLRRLDEIADLIATLDADIVVLNEVDFDSTWSHGVNQAAHIAHRAGYAYSAEQRNMDARVLFTTWRFGNAILSRYPIVDARVVALPGYAWYESLLAGKKRSLACTMTSGGHSVTVVAVHLSHRSEHLRVRSIDTLTHATQPMVHPIIMAGDFNSTPPDFPHTMQDHNGTNALACLDDIGYARHPADSPAVAEMTYDTRTPTAVIDWIVIPSTCEFEHYAAVDSHLSDHRPVCATILLPR